MISIIYYFKLIKKQTYVVLFLTILLSNQILPQSNSKSATFFGITDRSDNNSELIEIDQYSGLGTLKFETDTLGSFCLAINSEGNKVAANRNNGYLYTIDSLTGGILYDFNPNLPSISCIAFTPTDKLYAFDRSGNLYYIDLIKDTTRVVISTGGTYSGFTFDPKNGELYACMDLESYENDAIVKIDTSTGSASIIGYTLLEGFNQDIAFDQTGRLYGLKGGHENPNILFEIDKDSGEGIFVGDSTGYRGITSIAAQFLLIEEEQPQILVDPPFIEYGDIIIDTYVDKIVRIHNPGDATLDVSSIEITGANTDDFTIPYGGVSFSIYRGSYRDITIRFAPKVLGTSTASIEITSNDPDENLVVVPFTGNCVAPLLPDITVDPEAHDFGDVIIGIVKGMTFKIINDGDADLQITSIRLGGANYSEFFFSPQDPSSQKITSVEFPFSIAPGDTHDVDVIVMPKTKGEKNAILTIRSNDPDEDPFDIALKAMAFGTPDISASPSPFYYGNVDVGSYKEQNFTIYNDGEEDLNVSAISLSGYHSNEFSIVSGGAPITILPQRSSYIRIRFEPQTVNEKYADLIIESDDPDENPYIVELSANRGPEPPTIKIVYPYYDAALSMYVEWTEIIGAQEYQYRRKIDNGTYSDWVSTGNAHFFLDNSISAGPEYAYQVRVKIEDEFSFSSRPRSSRAVKVWPVKEDSLITSPNTREILNGFNTALQAGATKYLHEGLDIQGEGNVNDELVVAPLGGVITRFEKTNAGSNIYFNMRIRINGQVRNLQFNHLKFRSINTELSEGWSIAPGEVIGRIASGFFNTDINNHTHFHYWDNNMMTEARNPLLLFDKNENKDPYQQAPVVQNTNADGDIIRFTKGRNSNTYFPNNKVIYTAADIVAEITDHQSKDIPWVTPQKVGYYIKQHKDGVMHDIVRNSSEPYILLDGENWYGNSTTRPHILFDMDNSLRASTASFVPAGGWWLWYTYKVTNTSGTDGSIATLDANQCWATNAKNTEASENGYRGGYSVAYTNEEALFPDRDYSVYIRSADFVNTAKDFSHKVLVDNFKPYVKKCLVESAGSTIYFAKWDWDGSNLSLDPEKPKDGIMGTAKVNRNVKIVITTSEPMKELYIENILPLNCGIINSPDFVNTDSTEWTYVVEEDKIPDDGSKNGLNIIHIRGIDKANNQIQGYNENETKYYKSNIAKRKEDGNWDGTQIAGADRVHRFIIGMVDVAFVIDDTGSMGEEISGVRQALLNHLATYADDSTTTFLLVTFKDGVSVGEPTSDLSLIQSQVSALYASGGGDCPEGSVEAINAIRDIMNDNGRVLLATDAAPHPGVDNSATIAALQARGVRVDAILSGDCNDVIKILAQFESSLEIAGVKDNLQSAKAFKNRTYKTEVATDTLQLGDEDFRAVPLPFKFPFSNQNYDTIYVGSNGFITFETGSTNGYSNYSALITGPPRIAGFFTDLSPQDGGKISVGQVSDDEYHVVFDTVKRAYSNNRVTFSIILRSDGTFAFEYGDIETQHGIVGFSVGEGVLDPGETDLSEAEQPIAAKNYGTTYQVFSYNVDIFNTRLEFERVTYVKPPTYNAVQAFSLMAKETGGIFAYVPEVNYSSEEEKQRFENIIFNIVQGAITQSLALVEPKKAPVGTDITVSLTGSGTNFQSTTSLDFLGSGITIKRINVTSAIHLEADIHIDNSTELGFKDIVAITPLGSGVIDTARGIGAFEVIEQPYYPTIVGITPNSGQPGQSLTVIISGVKTNFNDTSEVNMGSGIIVNSIEAISPTILRAGISIASNTDVGFRDITVKTGYEWAYENLTGPFFVSMTAPEKSELVSISPSIGAPGTHIALTIRGNNTHFLSGSSIVTFSGKGIKLLDVEVIDTTELFASIEIESDAAPGFRDVRVNTDTESAVFLSGFLVSTNKPKVQITSALFQNPASTKYCDIVVITDQLLSSPPLVQVTVSGDTSNVSMSLIEESENVYKGSYEFDRSGEHWITTNIHTTEGVDSTHRRNFEVLLAKKGFEYVLYTPDKEAKLYISKSIIQNDIYFLADNLVTGEERIYMFGPESEFKKTFNMEISYDKNKFTNPDKLFIYQFIENNWIAQPSKVYPLNNSIKAQVNKLGKFKIAFDSTFTGNNIVPFDYALQQCYPNPFNPSTTIEYNLPEDVYVNLKIYDTIGQEIIILESGEKTAGRYRIIWNASGIASGIYFYQLKAGEFIETKKMILLR